jgi:hypothetical protein
MATTKKHSTGNQVQGNTIGKERAREEIDGSRRNMVREQNIAHLQAANETAIDEAVFEAPLEALEILENSRIKAAAAELARRTRAEQALPPKIKDPAVISRVVALLQPLIEE